MRSTRRIFLQQSAGVALAAHVGIVPLHHRAAAGAWIVGFALLLVACRVRGL